MDASKVRSLRAVALIFGIDLGFWVLYGFLAGLFEHEITPLLELFVDSLLEIQLMVLLVILVCRLYGMTLLDIGFRWQGQRATLLIGPIIGLLAFSLLELADTVPIHLLPDWPIPSEYDYLHVYQSAHGILGILSFVSIAMLTPISEEILYRGLTFALLGESFSRSATLLISACLFGAVHVFPSFFIVGFIIGCLLGWMRIRSKSLLGPILAHSTYNAGVLLTG
jgi:hypothetical protein